MHTLSHSLVQAHKNIYSYTKCCHKIPNQELSGRMLELEVTCSFLKRKKKIKLNCFCNKNKIVHCLYCPIQKGKKASKRDLAAVN